MTGLIGKIGPLAATLTALSLALPAVAGTGAPPADAAPQAEERHKADAAKINRGIVADAMRSWAAGTGGPYDLLADDAVWTIAGHSRASATYPGREAFMSAVIRPFNARMKRRLIPTVHRIYAEGDTVIAHFDAEGIARDGKPYVNSYVWILTMRDGRIVRAHAYFDAIAFDDLWTRVQPAR